jgi:hypothetical protein
LADAIARKPPSKRLNRSVFSLSRERPMRTRSRSTGRASTIGVKRSFDHASAASIFGCTTMIGRGRRWIAWPRTFSTISDLPSCDAEVERGLRVSGSPQTSIGSRW